MELTIYKCDRCGVDCSAYENRVVVNFPYGETKHLCLDCATKVFEKEESEAEL
jgi:DNA-directed RNA polymerase subunit RPC12/RpoP